MRDFSIIRIVQSTFRPEGGLTHKLTHCTKFAGGNSGAGSMNELLILEGKGAESLRNARIFIAIAIRKHIRIFALRNP